MQLSKIILVSYYILIFSLTSFSQDRRTLDTRIADLLVQFPASDLTYTDILMEEMGSLGEEGLRTICSQIIPAGEGDDTKQRFAVESFSRYLSRQGKEKERPEWEKICISFATTGKDPGVIDFFIKQLHLVGSSQTAEALEKYLSDKVICSPAISAILAVGGKEGELILAESLKDKDLPCAAAVMNALASMQSALAVAEYIKLASVDNPNTKAAAYNALAMSGDPRAYPVLLQAARSYSFRWEHSGATASLLNYAVTVAQNGDLKTMDEICRLLISKCNDKLTIQYKTAALETYVTFHGIDALPEILKASSHPNQWYRKAAIDMSSLIESDQIVDEWIKYFPKAVPAARPEIIQMLGNRRDIKALDLISSSLQNPDQTIRLASAEAVAKLAGASAAPLLVKYIMEFPAGADQDAAVAAFMSIAGKEETELLKPVLQNGSFSARKSAIELMAWKKDHDYFSEILPFASSSDLIVKVAAIKALADLSGPEDQYILIDLLLRTNNETYIHDLQSALVSAANQENDPERRSDVILELTGERPGKERLIPVLAQTAGSKALAFVLEEFENGTPEMREICFRALSSWKDYTASSALYEICASGNKTYEAPAFEGYVRQVISAKITDEQKLLLLRKIMPFALSSERKISILTELGKLKTYPALFFVADYLDDPGTSAVAAQSVMYIALPSVGTNQGMSGIIVRQILEKALEKLSGPEREYHAEMINKYLGSMSESEGFVPMFNGKDLTGWQGLVENPIARSRMKTAELEKRQAEADKKVPLSWSVKDGCIWFNGNGENLCSVKLYGDFELLVDWKITEGGDSGIYLRGTPQVQIWDASGLDPVAKVGSGGLYNNEKNPSDPLKVADNPVGEWNSFRIIMTGEKVSVWLNGVLVVDSITMENYWDRSIPIFEKGPVELQAHGTDLAFRDIYIREISDKDYDLLPGEKAEGFVSLFNGRNLDGWVGDKIANYVKDGMILTKPEVVRGGNIYTEKEYSDFVFRFDFLLSAGANNGLGIRTPLTGNAAYVGMEVQIIDNTTTVFGKLQPYQLHGSVYGIIPAKPGYLKPVGEWNSQEVIVRGSRVKVILNGTVILDGDVVEAAKRGTMDGRKDHTGLMNRKGHIGFLYHNSEVKFKNIRIKEL